jgi:hypothetical protein
MNLNLNHEMEDYVEIYLALPDLVPPTVLIDSLTHYFPSP